VTALCGDMAYRGSGSQGGVVSRPLDGDRDPRTPMAWQHRDQTLQPGASSSSVRGGARSSRQSPSRNGGYQYREGGGSHTPSSRRAKSQDRGYSRSQSRDRSQDRRQYRSQPSPSTTEGTADDTTETDTVDREGSEYQMQMLPGYPMMVGYPMMAPGSMMPLMLAPGTGSIRSVQSMPMLAHGSHVGIQPAHTWDGEPCPVHHHGHGMMPGPHPMMPMAALYGMPSNPYGPAMSMPGGYSVPQSVISGATTVRRARSVAEMSQHGLPGPGDRPDQAIGNKSLHASMASLAQSHHHGGQTGGQPGPPGQPQHHRLVLGENGAPSKLPIRQRPHGNKPSPIPAKKNKGVGCCSGHFVIIWIILGIVTFGVLLGVILKFTVK